MNSEKLCIEFIDKYITCERDEEGEMEKLIKYQIHKHSPTCRKGGRGVNDCRFSYPKPPLDFTQILHPLPKDFDKKEMAGAKENYKKIQKKLNEMGRNFKDELTMEYFLETLDLTDELYTLAIRSSIKRSTVFLKRKSNEIFVNAYNKKILLTWKANMDIQFVLDTYACAKYCVGYMLKAEGGISKLLRAVAQEIRNGNTNIGERLAKFATILIKGTEISAQEAVAFLLGLASTYSNRAEKYINTAPFAQRIGMVKSKAELAEMADDCEDVCEKGLLDRYEQRPVELQDVCLADFAALYTFSKKKSQSKKVDDEEVEEEDNHEMIIGKNI